MEKKLREKLGSFAISLDLIERYPEVAKLVLKDLIVVRAELRYDSMSVEYTAIGDDFETEFGDTPTRYTPQFIQIVDELEDNTIVFTPVFQRFSKDLI